MLFLYMLMGANPQDLMREVPQATQVSAGTPNRQVSPKEEALRKFVGVVLKDTEDVWTEVFKKQLGRSYVEPKLVLFTGAVKSACGTAGSQVGPFYCPGDSNVYLDLQFFDELSQKLGAKGDLAMAYVVAHEVGHHVQNQLGISEQVQRAQARASKVASNELSVRTELQADFLAGVFIHHAQKTKQILEKGDIEEALVAANQIGDDTLQGRGGRRVSPENFTHGTSDQRKLWLTKGIQTGDMSLLMKPFELSREELGL
jgi:hypothetical protein